MPAALLKKIECAYYAYYQSREIFQPSALIAHMAKEHAGEETTSELVEAATNKQQQLKWLAVFKNRRKRSRARHGQHQGLLLGPQRSPAPRPPVRILKSGAHIAASVAAQNAAGTGCACDGTVRRGDGAGGRGRVQGPRGRG